MRRVAGEEWPVVSGTRTVVVVSGQKMRREVTGGDRKASEQGTLNLGINSSQFGLGQGG